MLAALLAAAVVAAAPPQWEKDESAHLKDITQVTKDFVRAGEGYFSPDGKTIIFQAEEKDTAIRFTRYSRGSCHRRRAASAPASVKCTCTFPPRRQENHLRQHASRSRSQKHYAEEYQRRKDDAASGKHRRYKWDFDPYMTIFEANPDGTGLKRLTHAKGYNAEGSYSPDGKQIVLRPIGPRRQPRNLRHGHRRQKRPSSDACAALLQRRPILLARRQAHHLPQRSEEKDHLQLYVINADGTGEKALTNNLNWVSWGPYWYKDGKHIVYTAADHGMGAAQLRSLLDEDRHG